MEVHLQLSCRAVAAELTTTFAGSYKESRRVAVPGALQNAKPHGRAGTANFRRSVPRAIRRVLTAPEVFFLMRAGANSAERIMAVP